MGVLWGYWVLARLGEAVPQTLRETLQWDISQQHPTDVEFQQVAELCLEAGYVRTLHESMLVFLPVSRYAWEQKNEYAVKFLKTRRVQNDARAWLDSSMLN